MRVHTLPFSIADHNLYDDVKFIRRRQRNLLGDLFPSRAEYRCLLNHITCLNGMFAHLDHQSQVEVDLPLVKSAGEIEAYAENGVLEVEVQNLYRCLPHVGMPTLNFQAFSLRKSFTNI